MKRFWWKLTAWAAVIVALCGLVTAYVINPAAYRACEAVIRAEMMTELNNAALGAFDGSIRYEDLFQVEKDSTGKIILLGANTPKLNEIAKSAAQTASERTTERAREGVSVDLGMFTGISYLSGAGREVTFDVEPAGFVDVTYVSHFETAGVNQTLHRISAKFRAVFDLLLPLAARRIEVSSEMLVCETVLVGEVPDIWLENGDGTLNFVPGIH